MSNESNKALARRFIEEVVGNGNLDLLDELMADTFVDHNLPSGVTPRQSIAAFRAGFPDTHVEVEDVISEGDKAVVRYTVYGTHSGTFFGIPPTGKQVTMPGISIYRIADDKIAEAWVQYDQLGIMQQLGVVPAAG